MGIVETVIGLFFVAAGSMALSTVAQGARRLFAQARMLHAELIALQANAASLRVVTIPAGLDRSAALSPARIARPRRAADPALPYPAVLASDYQQFRAAA